MRNYIAPTVTVSLALALLAGCAGGAPPGSAAPPTGDPGPLEWAACDELVAQLAELSELIPLPTDLKGWEDRMQCGQLSVPLDHADPTGRQIDLAVSRLLPEQDSRAVVLMNPGGPGVEGRTMPAQVAATPMGDLARDHTLVGVDVRGTGASTSVMCEAELELGYSDEPVDQSRALSLAQEVAAANSSCVASDPEFFAQLTTQNAARDLDLVRVALGVEQVHYFGASWGTELGVSYLTTFPRQVGRMLLDSMIDLRHDAAASLDDIARVSAAAPADRAAPAGLLVDGGYVLLNDTTRTAMTCNAYAGGTDPVAVWTEHLARAQRLGLDPRERTAHPISAGPGTSMCAGWPFEPRPLQVPASAHDNLQIVAHATETVTPAVWSERAHDLLGGHLAVLPDADHGSVVTSSAAQDALDFLRTGTPMP